MTPGVMRAMRRPSKLGRRRAVRIALFAGLTAAAAATASCAGCDGDHRAAFDLLDAVALPMSDRGSPAAFLDSGESPRCAEARQQQLPLGCEYAVFAVRGLVAPFACTAVLVSNPGDEAVALALAHGDTPLVPHDAARLVTSSGVTPGWAPLDQDTLPPHASAVIALAQGGLEVTGTGTGACPFPPALNDIAVALDVGDPAPAFWLRSSGPVYATYFYPYTGERSAVSVTTALRATSSWTSAAVDVGVFKPGRPLSQQQDGDTFSDTSDMAGFAALVARRSTTFFLTTDAGPLSIAVAAGFAQRVRRDDLFIGSTVSADEPFGFFVGSPLSFIPYNVRAADPLLSQVAPPSAWGNEYAAVAYPRRYEKSDDPAIYRIVAERDGTAITFDPTPPPDAPSVLNAGELATFSTSSPFVVKSQDEQHRFHLSLLMTGEGAVDPEEDRDAGIAGRGDPELVSVPPPAEYASRFAFMTAHWFPDTHLVLVRKKHDGVFSDVTLDCAGTLAGWIAIDDAGTYETTTVTLSHGAFEGTSYPGGTCNNGAHTLVSNGPLTGFVWGWGHKGAYADPITDGSADSYGFALYGLPPASTKRTN